MRSLTKKFFSPGPGGIKCSCCRKTTRLRTKHQASRIARQSLKAELNAVLIEELI